MTPPNLNVSSVHASSVCRGPSSHVVVGVTGDVIDHVFGQNQLRAETVLDRVSLSKLRKVAHVV